MAYPDEILAKDAADLGAEGFVIFNIAAHSNILLVDYAAELMWNPEVWFDEFLREFAQRRYGAESAENMVKCYGRLLDAAKNRLVFALICPAEASPMMRGILIHLHIEDVEKCLKKMRGSIKLHLKRI